LQEELGQYDYGARFYDPVVARWNVIDRFSEKYVNSSPYAYVLDNPIKSIDINGDTLVTKNDVKVATDMQKDFQKTNDGLTKDRDTKKSEVASGKDGKGNSLTQKQTDRLNKQIAGLDSRIGEVQKSMSELNEISADPNHGYTFNDVGSSAPNGLTQVNSNGYIEIDYMGTTSSFAHELAHGSGVAEGIYPIMKDPKSGQMGFGLPHGTSLGSYEVRAYRAQFGLDPSSMPNSSNGGVKDINDITPDYVYGITDGGGNSIYPRP
jgi:RHS repeat-associated protein